MSFQKSFPFFALAGICCTGPAVQSINFKGGIKLPQSKSQNYLYGATILAAGVVVMKILGAIYKIPLGNILGDVGYTYFTVAYNIYNVLLTVSTAGLPVALSRMVSEANTLDRPRQARRMFHVALGAFFVLGLIGTAVMFYFPTELAVAMDKPEASQSIWALSPAVLLVCLTSAYRGYAQGYSNMTPTTISQVLEVLAKVVSGLIIAWLFTRAGKSLPLRSAGAIFGVSVGGLAALLYIMDYKRRSGLGRIPDRCADVPDRPGKILGTLMRIGVPITLGSSVMSLITLVDTKLVLNRLQNAAGFTGLHASELFGVYSKASTLYNLPAAFITPMAISVVPAVAACVAARQRNEAGKIAQSALGISTLMALPMGVGLLVLANPIMNVLYVGANQAGTKLLAIMGLASYFVCMALVSNAILQAHGSERYPVYSMIAGGLAKILINWILVGNPDINIYGAPVGTLVCYAIMCAMNLVFMGRCMARRPSLRAVVLKPLLASAAMGGAAWAVYGLASRVLTGADGISRMMNALAMGAAIAVGVAVYLILVVALRAVSAEELRLIPKGEKLARLLKIQ